MIASSAGANPILDTNFDSGSEGFAYADDVFRGTNQPYYASGTWAHSQGNPGGALAVHLGGINAADVLGMSGGWQTTFELESPSALVVTFDYELTQSPHYENDEFSQVLVKIDGVPQGLGSSDHVDEIRGNGNGGSHVSTGWATAVLETNVLSAGTHTITFGEYNNKKTYTNESSALYLDNLKIETLGSDQDPDPSSDSALDRCVAQPSEADCCETGQVPTYGTDAQDHHLLSFLWDPTPRCIFARGGGDHVDVGPAASFVAGELGEDALYGNVGDDFMVGGPGLDGLYGNAGNDRLYGGADKDWLYGESGDDLLVGGDGSDELYGGAGSDILRPGTGADLVFGEQGNDRIEILSTCEIDPGLVIDGGPGSDTVVSPISRSRLTSLGVTLVSVENVVVSGTDLCRGNGVCNPNPTAGDVCICDGLWEGTTCSSCPDGFHFKGPGGEGPFIEDALGIDRDAVEDTDEETIQLPNLGAAGISCVPTPTCATVHCGTHGVCEEQPGGATCVCDLGFDPSSNCQECSFPFVMSGGTCVLDPQCDQIVCGGRGTCDPPQRTSEINCTCNAPYSGAHCSQGGPNIEFADAPRTAGTRIPVTATGFVPKCPSNIIWDVTGPGRIEGNGLNVEFIVEDSEFAPGATLAASTITARFPVLSPSDPCHEVDPNPYPEVRTSSAPSQSIPVHEPSPAAFDQLDIALQNWMSARPWVPGLQVAINVNGTVVYSQALGFSDRDRTQTLTNEHAMRVASVSKSITAATFRAVQSRWQSTQSPSTLMDDDSGVIATLRGMSDSDLENVLGLVYHPFLGEYVYKHINGKFDPRFVYDRNDSDDYYEKRWEFDDHGLRSTLQTKLEQCEARSTSETTIDPWLERLELKHLLLHQTGNDSAVTSQSMNSKETFKYQRMEDQANPYTARDRTRLFARECLLDPPGTGGSVSGSQYSNVGYELLAQITAIAGERMHPGLNFEDLVRFYVLRGLDKFRIGHTPKHQAFTDEVEYDPHSIRTSLMKSLQFRPAYPHAFCHTDKNNPKNCGRSSVRVHDHPTGPLPPINDKWLTLSTADYAYGGWRNIQSRQGDAGWVSNACSLTHFAQNFGRLGHSGWLVQPADRTGRFHGSRALIRWEGKVTGFSSSTHITMSFIMNGGIDDRDGGSDSRTDLRRLIDNELFKLTEAELLALPTVHSCRTK